MRIMIAAIGRLKTGAEKELVERYQKRFDGTGRTIGLGPLVIAELLESRDSNAAGRKSDESLRLLDRSGERALIVALDEKGRSWDSEKLAEWVGQHRDDGTSEIAFLVGGPDGHGRDVIERSSVQLSLGAMTLPHGLARVVLVEQLYRVATILSGHPYHRSG